MRRRSKNKGFTLIEVIIALAILAVALAPLIANFIVSSKMNLKSRKNLNAMNLAQDMMEGMRAYSAEDLIAKLDAGTGSGNAPTLIGTILPNNTTAVNDCSLTPDASKPNATIYTLSGVQTASGNYNTYNVMVTLKPDPDKSMADVPSVDPLQDATYTMEGYTYDSESAAVDYFRTNINTPSVQVADIKKNMSRRLVLRLRAITDPMDPSNKTYTVTVQAVYTIKQPQRSTWGLDDTQATYTDGEHNNVFSGDSATCPRAVYIYYKGLDYPAEDSDPTKYNEQIELNNMTEEDVTVYLIRTQDSDPGVMSSLMTYNNNYRCCVSMKALEVDGATEINLDDDTAKGKIHLVTNVRYHLNYGANDNKCAYDDAGLMTISSTDTYYDKARAVFYYNSTLLDGNPNFRFYKKYVSDGYQKVNRSLLYQVDLTVMEGTKVIATYSGGTVN